jgi:hypothetical protein
MARTRARLAIGATGRHRSQQSDRRGHCRLALLARPQILFLTAWQTSQAMAARIHLAGSSDRKAFGFQEQSPLPAQVPVCLSASSVRPVLGSWLQHIRQRLLQSPPPSNRAWPENENIRFDKRNRFSELVFLPHYRFGLAIWHSPCAEFCRYFSALRRKIPVNRCHTRSYAEDYNRSSTSMALEITILKRALALDANKSQTEGAVPI